jgi:hypothetical protein
MAAGDGRVGSGGVEEGEPKKWRGCDVEEGAETLIPQP